MFALPPYSKASPRRLGRGSHPGTCCYWLRTNQRKEGNLQGRMQDSRKGGLTWCILKIIRCKLVFLSSRMINVNLSLHPVHLPSRIINVRLDLHPVHLAIYFDIIMYTILLTIACFCTILLYIIMYRKA